METMTLSSLNERFRAAHTKKALALSVLLTTSTPTARQQAEGEREAANQELELLHDLQDSLYALEDLAQG